MKTATSISKIFIVCCLFFFGFSILASKVEAKTIRTEMVLYNNTWIPSVHLKEVIIFAKSSKTKNAVLCQMVISRNRITPFVELKELTITPCKNFLTNNVDVAPIVTSHLIENKFINGRYMPHIDLNEIEIVASSVSSTNVNSQEIQTSNDQQVLQISVRKTFDRLANFLVGQGKIVLRKLLPNWFAE